MNPSTPTSRPNHTIHTTQRIHPGRIIHSPARHPNRILFALLPLLVALCGLPALRAQSPVISFSASYVTAGSPLNSYTALPASPGVFNACSSTVYTHTFSNSSSNQDKLNSFNANGSTYFVSPSAASTVKLRRVTNANATGNRSIVFMESTFSPAISCPSPAILSFVNPYQDSMENILKAGNLNQGTDNIFTNASNGDGNNNNIERVDILFPGGLNTASPTQAGFAIFDRGSNYQHDPFRIVAITGLDVNGDPATFGAIKKCTGGNGSNNNGSYGHPSTANGNKLFAAYVMRKDAAEPYLRVSSNVNQEIGGVFYTFADLGISPGQPLYGYALLAPDGIASPTGAQLLNINDNTVYPTNTTEANGGGLDLIAVNTVFATGSYIVLGQKIDSFSGNIVNGAPRLLWTLENLSGGEQAWLERSRDAVSYAPIDSWDVGDQPLAQTSSGGSYTDAGATDAGNYYYRLKILGTSGETAYSRIVELETEGAGSGGGKIYPTVLTRSESLTIRGIKDGTYVAGFYNYGGALRTVPVLVQNNQGHIDQPAGGLAPGIYWLRITGTDGSPVAAVKALVQ